MGHKDICIGHRSLWEWIFFLGGGGIWNKVYLVKNKKITAELYFFFKYIFLVIHNVSFAISISGWYCWHLLILVSQINHVTHRWVRLKACFICHTKIVNTNISELKLKFPQGSANEAYVTWNSSTSRYPQTKSVNPLKCFPLFWL